MPAPKLELGTAQELRVHRCGVLRMVEADAKRSRRAVGKTSWCQFFANLV
jgi:hypothetical protein